LPFSLHANFALAGAAALLALGCTTDDVVVQTGLPGARAATTVDLIAERGDYLDVMSEAGRRRTRFLVPNDEACRSLFVGEIAVSFSNSGRFGRFQAGDQSCDPVGVLSLAQWRDRRPRAHNASIVPRSRSDLRERIYADDDIVLIRGRFMLAGQIGITGGSDLIAVLPNAPECEGLDIPSSVSMEFRQSGSRPFTILNGSTRCPVIGFVQPPGQ
jgi:hypothetical protein